MTKNVSKILIAVGDVAAGHSVPAAAIKQAIQTLHPERYKIEVVDFFQYRDPFPFKGGSAASVRITSTNPFLKQLNAAFWHLSNSRLIHPFERLFIQKRCGRHYYELLRGKAPDLLITVHPYLSEILGQWRDLLNFQHAAVVLELGTPMRSSASNSFDLAISPTATTTRRLCQMGVPESKIKTGLFPFHPRFCSSRSRNETAGELGLNPGKPVILISGGGISTASMTRQIRELTSQDRQVIILAGKDRYFCDAIRKEYAECDSVRVIGFTDQVQDYFALADIVVAKPGASTVMEMEVLGKPCLLTFPAGPQERGNLEYALQNPSFRYAGRFSTRIESSIRDLLEASPNAASRRRLEETGELVTQCLSLIG